MADIEERLWEKAKWAIKELRGLREPKVEDIFHQRHYIGPEDLKVEGYLRSRPLAAFNPGALLKGEELWVFPRLIFDYYSYTSSIGVFQIPVEQVLEGKLNDLKVKIILWPLALWEFGHGCEDPRVFPFKNSIYMLYTGAGHYYEGDRLVKRSVLGFAEFDQSFEIKRRGYFSIVSGNDGFIPKNKDSALIRIKEGESEAIMLTRPVFKSMALCWRAEADLKTLSIPEGTLRPVLAYEEWEHKVGWSTNVVQLSENRYLVGWHGVLRDDLSYKNGLAVVDSGGELLAISDYLLAPKGLEEGYGDRPLVIFGNGLVKYKDYLIWIGGISDYGIGIFITEIEEALGKLKWLK